MMTGSPVRAALQGLLLGTAILVFFQAMDIPLDWKIGSIIFAVAALGGALYSFDRNKWSTPKHMQKPEVLMADIQWDFSRQAPAQHGTFVHAVAVEQTETRQWDPQRVVCPPGDVVVEILRLWTDDGETPTELTLEPVDSAAWTEGRLLFALHQAIAADRDVLADHTFFEGFIRSCNEPARLRLCLGS